MPFTDSVVQYLKVHPDFGLPRHAYLNASSLSQAFRECPNFTFLKFTTEAPIKKGDSRMYSYIPRFVTILANRVNKFEIRRNFIINLKIKLIGSSTYL